MPSGINYELDFEKLIVGMQDRQLLEFVARQSLSTNKRCAEHLERITALENTAKKQAGIIGGITGTITGAIIAIINYFATSRG